MNPDNFQAVSKLDPTDVPEGFTTADPNSTKNAKSAQQDVQRLSILQQALTPEALERLQRIKLVKPEKAETVEKAIVNLAVSGKLPGKMNEGKLIELLERGMASSAQSKTATISIQRKKYIDDSDDDDNDDDLL